MKVTKELERILSARKKAGESLMKYDSIFADYLTAKGIDVNDIDISFGAVTNCIYLITEPQVMYDATIEAIEKYKK